MEEVTRQDPRFPRARKLRGVVRLRVSKRWFSKSSMTLHLRGGRSNLTHLKPMSEHLKDNLKERMASGGESNLIIYLDQLFVFRLHGVLGFWGNKLFTYN